jgi:hypothetical protein
MEKIKREIKLNKEFAYFICFNNGEKNYSLYIIFITRIFIRTLFNLLKELK